MERIAIVGTGFSGTMLLYHLVKEAKMPFSIILFEKEKIPFQGIAYGTTTPLHLLNVKASQMSALEKEPAHFYNWVLEHESEWRLLDPALSTLKVSPEDYLPRMIYGAYLKWFSKQAFQLAKEKEIKINLLQKEAISLLLCQKGQCELYYQGGMVSVDKVLLAVGFSQSQNVFSIQNPRLIKNVWNSKDFFSNLSVLPATTTLAIVGSGLTMLDLVASLCMHGFKGRIIAFSRDGKMPEQHIALPKEPPNFFHPPSPTALALLKAIRLAIAQAHVKGYDWRVVIDSMRSSTIPFWKQLPTAEKKKLLPLLSLWNRHRHRMPPSYMKPIKQLKDENRFELQAGAIEKIEEKNGRLSLTIGNKKSFAPESLEVDYVLNCAGPENNILKNGNPLVRNLLQTELVTPDPIKMGLALSENEALKGKALGKLFAVGSLLLGEKLETTAVPELRKDAEKIANILFTAQTSYFEL